MHWGKRRTWLAGGVVVGLVAVGGFGGFRRSAHPLPEARLGERVELGRFAITVHDVYLTDKAPDGDALAAGDATKRAVVVDVTVEMLDADAGSFPAGDKSQGVAVQVRPSGALLTSDFNGGFSDALQPGLPTDGALYYVAPKGPPATVRLLLGQQEYAWTNLINEGPAWSLATPAVAIPAVPVENRVGRS